MPVPSIALSPVSKRIAITSNTCWSLVNFRKNLILALAEAGYEVIAIAPEDKYRAQLSELPCRYLSIDLQQSGKNPLADYATYRQFCRHFKAEQPHAVLNFTIKNNIYASLAAKKQGIACLNNISGLGSLFITEQWASKLARWLYRISQKHVHTVFFQNPDDQALFLQKGFVRPEQTALLPGSGVDLAYFSPQANPNTDGVTRFLLIARLLYDKGIGEYVHVAQMLRALYPTVVCCQLLGKAGADNPSAIADATLEQWQSNGIVDYLGHQDDVRAVIAQADCVVLPSYREGTPRALLEAAAMGKPLIASDAVGCREAVDDGETGWLCEVKSAESLFLKMQCMLLSTPEQRQAMGSAGRLKMQQQFDEKMVLQAYLDRLALLFSSQES